MKTKFASEAATVSTVDTRSGTTLVVAEGLKRHYPQGQTAVVALAAATCRIGPGQRIAIVGPSGSGKSTLLHLLGGLDEPSGGTICWPALGPRERLRPGGVAFMLQTPSLLPPLTVAENVDLPLLLQGIVLREARTRSLDILERLDLLSLVDKLPEELSGGQAQRVALARALVGRPRLLLADEPTGQLDHATAQHMFDVLLCALDDTETALVVATHDLEIAARMEQVWYMRHGILEHHQ